MILKGVNSILILICSNTYFSFDLVKPSHFRVSWYDLETIYRQVL
jgi:hypothetical protein